MHPESRMMQGTMQAPGTAVLDFLEAFHPTTQEYQMSLIPSETFNMLLLPTSKGKGSLNLLAGRP